MFAAPRVTRDTGVARMTLEQAADAAPLPEAASSKEKLVEQMGLLWDLEVARVQEEPKKGAEAQARYPTLEATQGQILSQSPTVFHRCHPILVAFVWESTKETINLPRGCLQGGPTLTIRSNRPISDLIFMLTAIPFGEVYQGESGI